MSIVNLCMDEGCPSKYQCDRFMKKPFSEENTYFSSMTRKEKESICKHFIEYKSLLGKLFSKTG